MNSSNDEKHRFYVELFHIKTKIKELEQELNLYSSLRNELIKNEDYVKYDRIEVKKYIDRYNECIKEIENDLKTYNYFLMEQEIDKK